MLSLWKRYRKGKLDVWTELLISLLLVLIGLWGIVGVFAIGACLLSW